MAPWLAETGLLHERRDLAVPHTGLRGRDHGAGWVGLQPAVAAAEVLGMGRSGDQGGHSRCSGNKDRYVQEAESHGCGG